MTILILASVFCLIFSVSAFPNVKTFDVGRGEIESVFKEQKLERRGPKRKAGTQDAPRNNDSSPKRQTVNARQQPPTTSSPVAAGAGRPAEASGQEPKEFRWSAFKKYGSGELPPSAARDQMTSSTANKPVQNAPQQAVPNQSSTARTKLQLSQVSSEPEDRSQPMQRPGTLSTVFQNPTIHGSSPSSATLRQMSMPTGGMGRLSSSKKEERFPSRNAPVAGSSSSVRKPQELSAGAYPSRAQSIETNRRWQSAARSQNPRAAFQDIALSTLSRMTSRQGTPPPQIQRSGSGTQQPSGNAPRLGPKAAHPTRGTQLYAQPSLPDLPFATPSGAAKMHSAEPQSFWNTYPSHPSLQAYLSGSKSQKSPSEFVPPGPRQAASSLQRPPTSPQQLKPGSTQPEQRAQIQAPNRLMAQPMLSPADLRDLQRLAASFPYNPGPTLTSTAAISARPNPGAAYTPSLAAARSPIPFSQSQPGHDAQAATTTQDRRAQRGVPDGPISRSGRLGESASLESLANLDSTRLNRQGSAVQPQHGQPTGTNPRQMLSFGNTSRPFVYVVGHMPPPTTQYPPNRVQTASTFRPGEAVDPSPQASVGRGRSASQPEDVPQERRQRQE